MQKRLFADCVELVGSACRPFEGTKKYVSTGAVAVDHISDGETESVTFSERPSRANLEVKAGDVLFAKMQGTKKTLLIDEETAKHIYSTGFFAVRAKKGVLTDRCLYHLLMSDPFLVQKDKNCSGATQKAITNEGLRKITVNIPDYEKQEGIVKQLDAIKAIIDKRQQELAALDDLVKSQFIEVIKPLLEAKTVVPLDDLIEDDRPITYGILKPGTGCPNGVPVVKVKDMRDGEIDQSDLLLTTPELDYQYRRSRLRAGDLLISIRGSVGRMAEVPQDLENANITQDTARLTIKPEYNKVYVRGVLESEPMQRDMERNIRGVAVKGINIGYLRALGIPLCDRSKQDRLAQIYQQSDKSKFAVQKALDKAQMLFERLMQQYFG